MNPRLAALLAVPLAGACFNPTYNNPTCGPGDACPDGFTCVGGICEREGGDDVDGSTIDADPNGCFHEADDAANDGNAEPTGRIGPSDEVLICGELRPGGDNDLFFVDTTSEHFAIFVEGPELPLVPAAAQIQVPATGQNVLAASVGDRVVVSIVRVPLGQVTIGVQAGDGAPEPIAYTVRMVDIDTQSRCPVNPTTYGESLDTAANVFTGNDVVDLSLGPGPTPLPSDNPEAATLVEIVPGVQNVYGGVASNVMNYNDSYKDRDVYRVLPSQDTTALSINLGWPGAGADLDWYLLREADLTVAAGSVAAGFGTADASTILVEPLTPYYLLVAGFQDQAGDESYQAAVCGDQL